MIFTNCKSSNNTRRQQVWQGFGVNGTFVHCGKVSGSTTMENNMKFSQNIKNRSTIQLDSSTPEYIPKENKEGLKK